MTKSNARVAYDAGWAASARATNPDLDAAEARFDRRHGRSFDPDGFFSAGWVDYAIDAPKHTALLRERGTSS